MQSQFLLPVACWKYWGPVLGDGYSRHQSWDTADLRTAGNLPGLALKRMSCDCVRKEGECLPPPGSLLEAKRLHLCVCRCAASLQPGCSSAVMYSVHLYLQIGRRDIILPGLGAKVPGQKEPRNLSPPTLTCLAELALGSLTQSPSFVQGK